MIPKLVCHAVRVNVVFDRGIEEGDAWQIRQSRDFREFGAKCGSWAAVEEVDHGVYVDIRADERSYSGQGSQGGVELRHGTVGDPRGGVTAAGSQIERGGGRVDRVGRQQSGSKYTAVKLPRRVLFSDVPTRLMLIPIVRPR